MIVANVVIHVIFFSRNSSVFSLSIHFRNYENKAVRSSKLQCVLTYATNGEFFRFFHCRVSRTKFSNKVQLALFCYVRKMQ